MKYVLFDGLGGGVDTYARELENKGTIELIRVSRHGGGLRHFRRMLELESKTSVSDFIITQGPLIAIYLIILLRFKFKLHIHNRLTYDSLAIRLITILFCILMPGKVLFASSQLKKDFFNPFNRLCNCSVILPRVKHVRRVKSNSMSRGDIHFIVAARNHPDKKLGEVVDFFTSSSRGMTLTILTDDDDFISRKPRTNTVNIARYSQEKLCNCLSTSQIYVSTSTYEAYGLAIIEAIEAGCFPLVRKDSGEISMKLYETTGEFFLYNAFPEIEEKARIILLDRTLSEKYLSLFLNELNRDISRSIYEFANLKF